MLIPHKDGHAAGAGSEGNSQGEGFRWGKEGGARRDKRRAVNTPQRLSLEKLVVGRGGGQELGERGDMDASLDRDRAGGFSDKEEG